MTAITIGFDASGRPFVTSQFEKELYINADEKKLAEHFIFVIKEARPEATISIERRASNYLSLCQGDYDFLRFKYSDRAKWLSLDSEAAGVSPDDPRFEAQKNKNQRHWKAKLSDLSELSRFDDLVISSIK